MYASPLLTLPPASQRRIARRRHRGVSVARLLSHHRTYHAPMRHLPIRYSLLLALEPIGTERSVSELVRAIRHVVDLGDRPSKFVSDLLRTEVRRGRVERIGWGRYRLVRFPRSTRQRARARLDAIGRKDASGCEPCGHPPPAKVAKDGLREGPPTPNHQCFVAGPDEVTELLGCPKN